MAAGLIGSHSDRGGDGGAPFADLMVADVQDRPVFPEDERGRMRGRPGVVLPFATD